MAKAYLDIYCEATSRKAKEIHGKRAVLRDGKVSKLLILFLMLDAHDNLPD